MLRRILALIWWVLTLPIKLILLPFKIVSAIVTIIFYAVVLLVLGGAIYLFVL